jgi:hypothetical protein
VGLHNPTSQIATKPYKPRNPTRIAQVEKPNCLNLRIELYQKPEPLAARS